MSSGRSRTTAEWATFAVACAVLLVLIGLIGTQVVDGQTEAAPRAVRSGPVRTVGDQRFVTVAVSNHGDATASNVQVRGSLVVDGEETEGDQTIDFLAGHETEELVFVFDVDPSEGELTVAVTGYGVP